MAKDIVDYQLELSRTKLALNETKKALAKAESEASRLNAVVTVFSGEQISGYPTLRTLVDVRALAKQELG